MNTRSKTFVPPLIALALLSSVFLGTLSAKAVKRSPHGFNPPQCTWWVDRRSAELDWDLHFRQDYGRDAWLWPLLLVNAQEITNPEPGCIAVFAPWLGAPVGHVAFVESIQDSSITISHANYAIGEIVWTVDGIPIRRAGMILSQTEQGVASFDPPGQKYKITFLKKFGASGTGNRR